MVDERVESRVRGCLAGRKHVAYRCTLYLAVCCLSIVTDPFVWAKPTSIALILQEGAKPSVISFRANNAIILLQELQ